MWVFHLAKIMQNIFLPQTIFNPSTAFSNGRFFTGVNFNFEMRLLRFYNFTLFFGPGQPVKMQKKQCTGVHFGLYSIVY